MDSEEKVVFTHLQQGGNLRNPISPNHLVNEEIGELVNEDEELTNLVDEEGSEAKNGLLLDDRANLLQAGHLQLPGQRMSS